jgi:hypothetical protein
MQVHGGRIKVPQDLAWEATLEKASNRELTSMYSLQVRSPSTVSNLNMLFYNKKT